MNALLLASGLPLLLHNGSYINLAGGGGTSNTTLLSLVDFAVNAGADGIGAMVVLQRAAGTLASNAIPVVYGFTGGAPTALQARVIKRVGGAVVTNWTALTGISNASATGVATLAAGAVPQGSDYLLQLRDGNTQPTSGPLFSAGSQRWGVGVMILFQGQSNGINTLSGGYLGYNVPGTSSDEYTFYKAGVAGGIFDTAGWHSPTNGNNLFGPQGAVNTATNNVWFFLRIIAAALATKYGYAVPVALSPHCISGQSISTFETSGSHWAEIMLGSGSSSSYGFSSPPPIITQDYEIVLWDQGEADSTYTPAAYTAALAAYYQGHLAFTAAAGRTAATLAFFPVVVGQYLSIGGVPNIENVRQGQLSIESYATAHTWPNVRVGSTRIDLPCNPSDGLHVNAQGDQNRAMRRLIQSCLKYLGCATFSGRGPTLGSVSRSGLVATIAIVHEGGTAITAPTPGNAISGFQANTAADFSGTNIAVTAAIAGASVQVTFPSGTAFPAYLKYMGGVIGSAASFGPDITNSLYDNVTYPSGCTGVDVEARGLPVLPTNGALTVS